MADRYLVATGNWSSTSVWSATDGGASGASVPTTSDIARLNDSALTVTLTADASVGSFAQTAGTIKLSYFTLTLGDGDSAYSVFISYSGVRTIDMGSGSIVINSRVGSPSLFSLSSSNLTLIKGSSTIVLNVKDSGSDYQIDTGGTTLNDLVVNLGSSTNSVKLEILGSPTFRSLIIQSKNSAAHTVNFDAGATVTVNTTFTGLGTSTGNISLLSATSGTAFNIASSGTTTSDYLTIQDSYATGSTWYAGAHSVNTSGNTGWIFTAPPPTLTGISTLTGVQSITF